MKNILRQIVAPSLLIGAIGGLCSLWYATLVVERDFSHGNPPFATPVEPRQVTGPSVKDVVRALGENDPDEVIDNPTY